MILSRSPYKLRPIEKEDLEWARLLHNDPSVLKMLTDPKPITSIIQKKWFSALKKSKKSVRLVALFNNQKIGVVRIDDLDMDNKSVCVGLDIHRDWRGQGHAKKIYQIILNHFFKNLRMNRCWLFVVEYNTIAKKLYQNLGFKTEGIAREALYRSGKYHDYILMSILKSEYKKSKHD